VVRRGAAARKALDKRRADAIMMMCEEGVEERRVGGS
jgi:hypothetical protein